MRIRRLSSNAEGAPGHMPLIDINDIGDPRLAVYRHLKAHNDTRYVGEFVLEGEKLLDRLLASPYYECASVLAIESRARRIAERVAANVPIYVLDEARISALVGYRFHLGVVSAGVRKQLPDFDRVCGAALERGGCLTLVVCPAVNDPENLGAIVRIADTFGANGVAAGPGCPDPLGRRVLRVSAGAVLQLPVWVHDDIEARLERLRASAGLALAAAVTDRDATPIEAFKRPPALALLLGNEAQGLSRDWIARSDHRLTIPMRPGADSLNVSVASGILLYHLMKR
jgi:tRNA G18 (ribose-2'-O)-methylase SpoU